LARGNRSQDSHERTAQERERDRLERERRRAAREGADAPASEPPSVPEQAPEPEQPPAIEPPAIEPPVAQPVPEQAAGPVLQTPPIPEPEEQQPPPSTQELPPIPPAEFDSPFLPRETDMPFAPPHPEPPEMRMHREAMAASRGADGGGGARKGGGAGMGRDKGPRSARRGPGARGTKHARIAALFALVLAAALVWFLLSLFQPFAGDGHGRVIVQIPKGSSSSKVGSILAHDDVVSSGFFFDLRALLAGKRSSLHSGRFVLKHDMSYSAAIDALSKPPPKVIAVKVVIPEGYTRRQIADLVREDALSGDYLAASERSRLLSPRHYGAPSGTRNLEGFLFPATYDLRAGAPVQKLVNEQLIAFRRRFGSADTRRAHALGVTPYEMLTVASMIEREAQSEHDRPLIAAVIYNRLREGIPLGIDATIYYAVEQQKGIATYAGELTQSMLKIDSPYNTRTHKGLPPTPISNPGEASIHAAAHPAHVPYLYYVAGADGCGEQVFSKTYAQFEKDVAAYDAAVKKNGGKPPACKKK
jgi:UPF0755 protein